MGQIGACSGSQKTSWTVAGAEMRRRSSKLSLLSCFDQWQFVLINDYSDYTI